MKKNNIVIPAIASLCMIGAMFSTVSCSGNQNESTPEDVTITMGTYPQTKVNKNKENELYLAIKEATGEIPLTNDLKGWNTFDNYYVDGYKTDKLYKDVVVENSKFRAVFYTTENNNKVTNHYDFFRFEPISWNVVSDDGLLFSTFILDRHMYDHNKTDKTVDGITVSINNYSTSDIRQFINGNFMNTAFTAEEIAKIATTKVDNSIASTGTEKNEFVGVDTNDKLFLLSMSDLHNSKLGFKGKEDRGTNTTDYAAHMGSNQSESYGVYWTRTPKEDNHENAYAVIKYGYTYYYNCRSITGGVRPALRLVK